MLLRMFETRVLTSLSARVVARAAVGLFAVATLIGAPVAAQQTGTISGTVTSFAGQPLQEVVLQVQGTELTALSNADGNYLILNVPVGEYQVSATYIGYGQGNETVTVTAGSAATADFQLQRSAVELEGVVVTGTAIASQRREVGNSIDLITAEDIEAAGVTSVEEILRGRIQGLTVTGSNATPGTGSELNIRGLTSINGRTSPLIYVDGVRVGSETGAFEDAGGDGGAASVLQSISPQDIERIEVIKGAAASTLYGSDATAGVIQIFTKRGEVGERARWAFSAQNSLVTPSFYGPGEDIDPTGMHMNRCDINGPLPQDTFPGPDPDCPESGSWFRNAYSQNYTLQVRGGTEGFSYFASGGVEDEQGIINAPDSHPGSNARNVFLRANLQFDPFESLQVSINNAYTQRDINFVPDGSSTNSLAYNVTRLRDGETEDDQDAQVFLATRNQLIDQFTIGSTVNWQPMDNMRHRVSAGLDWSNSNQRRNLERGFFGTNPLNGNPAAVGFRNVDIENNRVITLDYAGSWLWEVPGLYNFDFTTTWGGQLNDRESSGLRADTENFINRGGVVVEQGADILNANEDRDGFINGGGFLQQRIGWNNQVFLTAGLRVDSYNTVDQFLNSVPEYQVFPRLQATYTMSDHSWFPSDIIQTFRLRSAFGTAGDPPPQTTSRTLWDTRLAGIGTNGFVVDQIGNTGVEAERTTEFEFGLDASAFNGRVNLTGQYFQRNTDGGLIFNDPIPSLGIIEPTPANVGEWETWGYEATLDVNILQLDGLRWNLNTQYQYQNNEMINIGLDENNSFNLDSGFGLSRFVPGFPFPGIFDNRPLNADVRGELPTYSDTVQFYGVNIPPQEVSVNTSFQIGSSLTLDFFGYGQFGHFLLDGQALESAQDGLWPACVRVNELMTAWRDAGADPAAVPQELTAGEIGRCDAGGDPANEDWYEKGDYFRFSSASARYRIPTDWLPGGISQASIQFQALNLNLFTDFSGTDPDAIRGAGRQQRFRETGFIIPLPRTYSLNLRLNF